jgi:hypothetical protein
MQHGRIMTHCPEVFSETLSPRIDLIFAAMRLAITGDPYGGVF